MAGLAERWQLQAHFQNGYLDPFRGSNAVLILRAGALRAD